MKHNSLHSALVALLLITLTYSCSSEINISEADLPKEVLNVFKTKYPNAQDIKWEAAKEKGKFYIAADWKEKGKEKEIHITSDGTTITEEE